MRRLLNGTGLAALLLAAATTSLAAQSGHAHGSHAGLEASAPSDLSIYNLEGDWLDQNGNPMALTALTGRVQVVSMVYTNCAFACPIIVADMKRIEAGLPKKLQDRVGFVLVSVDPERDTPEQLLQFARSSLLDPTRWTLLNGSDDQILEVGAVLGVKVRRLADGELAHSNIITVLNRAGEIVHQQVGMRQDPERALDVIAGLLR